MKLLVSRPSALPRRLAAAAAVLAASAGAALVHPASSDAAGAYVHLACDTGTGIADAYGGWRVRSNTAAHGVSGTDACPSGGLRIDMNPPADASVATGEYSGWFFEAPANTTIVRLRTSLSGWLDAWDGSTRGVIEASAERVGRLALYTSADNTALWPGTVAIDHNNLQDTRVSVELWCDGPWGGFPCPGGSSVGWLTLFAPRVDLADDLAPTVGTSSGPAITDGTWKNTESLSYAATDDGGGIAAFRLYVDGERVTHHVIDTFGGHCAVLAEDAGRWVFGHPKPCPASVDAAELIDTTMIPDGAHTVTAKVVDAGQREATLFSARKVVANHPPVNTAAPAYGRATDAAAPVSGLALTANDGSWTGPELTYARGWLQCDASGATCVQIPGATATSYTPTAADLGHRLRYAVTATNAADSVTAYSPLTGVVSQPSSAEAPTLKPGGGGSVDAILVPGLTTNNNTTKIEHTFIGRVAGEPNGTVCPHDRATLAFEHVSGGVVRLGYGRESTAQVMLTCTDNGKAIADAKLELMTQTGSRPAVASDVTTDGAGHATLRLGRGASRGITVGYRMYADDPLARAVATLKVQVVGKVSLSSNRKVLRNGQAVGLRGRLAGGLVPSRGVTLAVQWRDRHRWRPFAQIKTNSRGAFSYRYKFTRTNRRVTYRLRVQVMKGQVDYPFLAAASRPVRVTVAP